MPYEELVGHWEVIEWAAVGNADRPTVRHLRELIVYLPFFTGPPAEGGTLEDGEIGISAVFLVGEPRGTIVKQGILENSLGVFVKGHTIRAGPRGFGHEFQFSVTLVKGETHLELQNAANRFVLKKAGPPPKPESQGLVYPSFTSSEIDELWALWRKWWRDNPPKKQERPKPSR